MAKRRFRWLRSARLWWIIFVTVVLTGLWQVYLSIPRLVISREIMGRMNDSQEVRLLFVGDTGTGGDSQRAVARQLESLCTAIDPTGVVLLGDNFYMTGVDSVSDPLWDSRFEKMYGGECLEKIPFYAVLGNHDYRSVPEAQIAYTRERGGRWTMPARYYSLRFGSLLEIGVADTNIPDRCGIPQLCSVDWLIDKLKSSRVTWKILIGHHPILSGGKHRNLKWLANYTLPELYCRSGVSVYISGHDHGLQHLHGKSVKSSCEIEQFISGGGGADLYKIDRIEGSTLYSDSAHGVLIGRFTSLEQRYEFFKLGYSEPQYFWSKKREQ